MGAETSAATPESPEAPGARGAGAREVAGSTDAPPDYLAASRLDGARLAELIAGATSDGADRRRIRMPWTNQPLYDLPLCGPDGVREAVRRARTAQTAWARLPVSARRQRLLAFVDDVLDRAAEALDTVQLETGKARRDAFEEIADIALVGRYYGARARELLLPRRRAGLVPFLTRVWEVRRPRGVVGIIAPWNYPLALAASDALPALLAGNAVILKPDPQTTLSALWVADALRRAGLAPDVFQVVPGDGPTTGAALVDLVDFMMFTGSTATGRTIARRAGERLIGFTMELGGKNSLIVLEDADPERAVSGILRGCFANAGQLCIGLERVLVHEKQYAAVRANLERAVPALVLAAGLDYEADVGSLVSEAQLEKTRAHVRDALDRGARLLVGGRHRPDIGPFFHDPTILEDAPPDAVAVREETFGPVASLRPFRHEAEALRLANEGSYGLNASVWTGDLHRGRRFASRIRAGSVNINDGYGAAWSSIDAPMGGIGDSGVGRRHGAEGLLKFTESQTIAAQAGHPLSTPAGVSHAAAAGAVMKGLRFLGRLRGS
ncbi:MAG TPA: succinic semialdehyde dehydrogenase [Longimicrobiales bacterium]|nr:succinic semialdehyde dehydrogenase [Longimicrobiales bacterium]